MVRECGMPDEEELTDNILRLLESAVQKPADELDLEASLADDLGFTRESLLKLAFTINADEYFKPLGVALIPDDVTDCETVGDLIDLVDNEFNNEMPVRRKKTPPPSKK